MLSIPPHSLRCKVERQQGSKAYSPSNSLRTSDAIESTITCKKTPHSIIIICTKQWGENAESHRATRFERSPLAVSYPLHPTPHTTSPQAKEVQQ